MKNFLLIIALFACCSCASDHQRLKEAFGKIENVAQIGTVEYTVTKLIIADDDAFYKMGDRKIIFSCKAFVKAGIDLKDFTAEDVKVGKDNSVVVTLPQPTVLSMNMPAEQIKVEFSKVSGLRTNFNAEERNELLKQGEANILGDMENLGILKDARDNAVVFFQTLLAGAGFESVVVNFKEKKEA